MDPAKLAQPMLLAILTQHYTELERRIAGAVLPCDPRACRELAEGAFELFLGTCDATTASELAPRRAQLVAAITDHRRAVSDVVSSVARRLDRPPFTGPINVAFNALRRINLVVVGAPGAAYEYARLARDQFLPESPLVQSTVGWDALEGRNAVLYGTAGAPMIEDVLAASHWQVTASHVAVGDRKIEGSRLALIACRARPCDPTLADVVYTAFDDQVLVGINALHHGPADYVIGRRTPTDQFQIVRRGNFVRGSAGELLTTLPA